MRCRRFSSAENELQDTPPALAQKTGFALGCRCLLQDVFVDIMHLCGIQSVSGQKTPPNYGKPTPTQNGGSLWAYSMLLFVRPFQHARLAFFFFKFYIATISDNLVSSCDPTKQRADLGKPQRLHAQPGYSIPRKPTVQRASSAASIIPAHRNSGATGRPVPFLCNFSAPHSSLSAAS